MKPKPRKTIRKIIYSAIALTILFAIGGVLYTLISDRTQIKSSANPASPRPPAEINIKPRTPDPSAKESAAVEVVTSPVAPGSNSSITVLTNAGSTCTITVTYNGVQSTDSGLAPKTADPYGNVTWTWTVGSSVPVGNWPIKVTCNFNGRSAVVDSSVQVAK